MNQRIIECEDMTGGVKEALTNLDFDRLFIITDSNVARDVLPRISLSQLTPPPEIIIIPAGETFKNIRSAETIWQALTRGMATRRSLIINLGGGMITDLGGFAAATFKRGLQFVNMPTSVLGAVDAATGGKTGIDFMGLKNEVGVFAPAEAVVISSTPFDTLPEKEWLSGYAELVKTLIISSKEHYREALSMDFRDTVAKFLSYAVREKQRITEEDPRESGLRKILNFGHTAGHALETLFLEKQPDSPLSHGEAVAFGMMTALVLSHLQEGLSMTEVYAYRDEILRPDFGSIPLRCEEIDKMLEFMAHDKKNRSAGEISFVLLRDIGKPVVRDDLPTADIRTALELTFI